MKNKPIELTSLFRIKSSDNDEEFIEIEGIANAANKDRVGDVVLTEAWTKGGLDNFRKNPIVLFQHKHDTPVGTVTDLNVTEAGLEVIAKIAKASGNVFSLIKSGVLKAFSVSFFIKDADFDSERDVFLIKDLELLELSVVSVPMNADSIFSLKKSFENDEDFEEFKKEFVEEETTEEEVNTNDSEENNELKEFKDEINNTIKGLADTITAALENKEETKTVTDITSTDNVEKLIADLEARIKAAEEKAAKAETIEDEKKALETETQKAIDELKSELKEKADELKALQEQKELFDNRQAASKITDREKDIAVLTAKALGVPIEKTEYFKKLVEKAGAHLASMTEDWESEFSTRVWDDIRERLVVEPLFDVIQMNTPTMHIPVNPDAGLAEWIGSASFRSSDGSSTGTATDHLLTDETLQAFKLVTKEYLGYEEEEDSIIPLVPIVREAMARRMARSADIALLRGAASGATDPIKGLTARATTDGNVLGSADQPSIAASDLVTVANLQKVRRLLGSWGLNPSDVTYVVSQDAYYDLLEDPDFRTIDMVGSDKATIIKGQIGFANGSPILVSNEFAAKGAAAPYVAAVNTRNFKVGTLRSLVVERDKNIEDQKNILVASRRMGFHQIIVGSGVATGAWKA